MASRTKDTLDNIIKANTSTPAVSAPKTTSAKTEEETNEPSSVFELAPSVKSTGYGARGVAEGLAAISKANGLDAPKATNSVAVKPYSPEGISATRKIIEQGTKAANLPSYTPATNTPSVNTPAVNEPIIPPAQKATTTTKRPSIMAQVIGNAAGWSPAVINSAPAQNIGSAMDAGIIDWGRDTANFLFGGDAKLRAAAAPVTNYRSQIQANNARINEINLMPDAPISLVNESKMLEAENRRLEKLLAESEVAVQAALDERTEKIASIDDFVEQHTLTKALSDLSSETKERMSQETGAQRKLEEFSYGLGHFLPNFLISNAAGAVLGGAAEAGAAAKAVAGASSTALSVVVPGAHAGQATAKALEVANLARTVGGSAGLATMFMSQYDSVLQNGLDSGADPVLAEKNAFNQAALEVGTEALFGGIMGMPGLIGEESVARLGRVMGSERVAQGIFNLAAKYGVPQAGATAVKTVMTVGKALTSPYAALALDIGGEAFEEMLSSAISPVIERATINPEAPDATPLDIMNAGIIGAIYGVIFSGGNYFDAFVKRGGSFSAKASGPIKADYTVTGQSAPTSTDSDIVVVVNQPDGTSSEVNLGEISPAVVEATTGQTAPKAEPTKATTSGKRPTLNWDVVVNSLEEITPQKLADADYSVKLARFYPYLSNEGKAHYTQYPIRTEAEFNKELATLRNDPKYEVYQKRDGDLVTVVALYKGRTPEQETPMATKVAEEVVKPFVESFNTSSPDDQATKLACLLLNKYMYNGALNGADLYSLKQAGVSIDGINFTEYGVIPYALRADKPIVWHPGMTWEEIDAYKNDVIIPTLQNYQAFNEARNKAGAGDNSGRGVGVVRVANPKTGAVSALTFDQFAEKMFEKNKDKLPNAKSWRDLSPEQQKVFYDAFDKAKGRNTDEVQSNVQRWQQPLSKFGITLKYEPMAKAGDISSFDLATRTLTVNAKQVFNGAALKSSIVHEIVEYARNTDTSNQLHSAIQHFAARSGINYNNWLAELQYKAKNPKSTYHSYSVEQLEAEVDARILQVAFMDVDVLAEMGKVSPDTANAIQQLVLNSLEAVAMPDTTAQTGAHIPSTDFGENFVEQVKNISLLVAGVADEVSRENIALDAFDHFYTLTATNNPNADVREIELKMGSIPNSTLDAYVTEVAPKYAAPKIFEMQAKTFASNLKDAAKGKLQQKTEQNAEAIAKTVPPTGEMAMVQAVAEQPAPTEVESVAETAVEVFAPKRKERFNVRKDLIVNDRFAELDEEGQKKFYNLAGRVLSATRKAMEKYGIKNISISQAMQSPAFIRELAASHVEVTVDAEGTIRPVNDGIAILASSIMSIDDMVALDDAYNESIGKALYDKNGKIKHVSARKLPGANGTLGRAMSSL